MTHRQVGMVLGSKEAGALDFWVAVREGEYLRLDDLVFVEYQHPNADKGVVRFYGMVDQVAKQYEGSVFATDVFLAQDNLLPVSKSYIAHVVVTRLIPEEYLPPDPGSSVYLSKGESLELTLYYDKMKTPTGQTLAMPVGTLKNGETANINIEFLNGFKGGHVNISGVSGVAAKTSYATFLLHSVLNSPANREAASTKAVVFNVKGEDLFYLDKANKNLSEADKRRYEILGLPAAPFTQVKFLSTPKPTPGDILPSVARANADVYYWDLVQFCREELLPYLFTDRGAMTNLGFVVEDVTAKLKRIVNEKSGQKGPHILVSDWSGYDKAGDVEFDALDKYKIRSFAELASYIEHQLLGPDQLSDEGKRIPGVWAARHATGTLEAFVRRLRGAVKNIEPIVRGDRPGKRPDPLESSAMLTVIDINKLSSQGQMFVVGCILREVFERQEGGRKGRVFVVLDELNKYAPREDGSPIKDILLDIAERGRSLGVILIGAQQTASEVERRVVGNAAIRVVGRLDAAEAMRPEYGYLSPTFRQRAVILPQGTMIVSQPEVPVPLALTFPMPAWAMKQSEALEDVSSNSLKGMID